MKWGKLKDRADTYRIRKHPGTKIMTLPLKDFDNIAAIVDAAKAQHEANRRSWVEHDCSGACDICEENFTDRCWTQDELGRKLENLEK